MAAVAADTDRSHRDADLSVSTVGTFAAGQTDDGRYVVAAEAPQSSFAAGQAEEDPGRAPTDAEAQADAAPAPHGRRPRA